MIARTVHNVEAIQVWRIEPSLLDALEPEVDRHTAFDLLRSAGQLYVTVDGRTFEGSITESRLVD